MINALSIDLEYWWSIELLKGRVNGARDDQVKESLAPLLDLLERYDTRATFFVLGSLAEKYPDAVEGLSERGHEIACHGYSHRTLHELGVNGFDEEVRMSLGALRKYRPMGFRAPTFSLDNSTRWALDVLAGYGFYYDSSVFPVKTMLYGVPDAPLGIYRPARDDITKNDPEGKMVELPLTVLKIGRNIPISGGFYFRALPQWFLKMGIREVNRQRPAVLYLHPWETYPETPRIGMGFPSRFITYHGIGGVMRKLEALMKEYRFACIADVLKEEHY